MKKLFFVFAAFCIFLTNLFAADIPDSSKVRSRIVRSWLKEDLEFLRMKQSEIFINEVEQKFEVRLEEYDEEFAIIVAPGRKISVEVFKDGRTDLIEADSYPATLPGSWVLYRDKYDGECTRIKMYFHPDSEIYVQFRPRGNKTLADFIIFGAYANRDVPIGLSFEKLYTYSFRDLKKLTGLTLPWQYVETQSGLFGGIHQMVDILRDKSEEIEYADDVAFNEDGKRVYISSGLAVKDSAEKKALSSAGYAKWIIDGLARPIAGSSLFIEPLKQTTVEFDAGSYNEGVGSRYNINFALDWTRHLASASMSLTSGRTVKYSPSLVDVTVTPFTGLVAKDGRAEEKAPEVIRNAGYSISIIKPLMCILAATESDYFYLGAVRESNHKTPEVFYFNEVVSFFPWFDESGHFMITVFESGVETSLNSFMRRYAGNYVHLVRVKASEYFNPQ